MTRHDRASSSSFVDASDPAALAPWFVGFSIAAVVVHVGSGFALASEQGPMFNLGTFLLGLLGTACVVTGYIHSGAAAARATWCLAGAVAFLMIGVEWDALWPIHGHLDDDLIDGVGWLLTAAVLGLFQRVERPPSSITKLLAAGFALQSVGILVDLADGGFFLVSDSQAHAMGTLDEILDFTLIMIYCASFVAVATYARAAAVSTDAPAAIIRRRARLARWNDGWRRSVGGSVTSAVVFPILALWVTWRNGAIVARRGGRPIARQLADQLRLAFLHGIPPSHYYVFELWDDGLRAQACDYLLRKETKGFAYAVLREKPITPLTDKLAFFRRCEAHQLSVVPVVLALDGKGQVLAPAFGPARLPAVDLFIKPNPGKGGRGAERWDYVGVESYRRFGGATASERAVFTRLLRAPFAAGCIVQPRVAPHANLVDLSGGALPTVRIVTCRHRDGRVEVTYAVFRMAQRPGTIVDNFHAGGIAAAVDLATGRLGRATDLGKDVTLGWVDAHPDTGARITGRTLPRWRDTTALAARAHREAFADRVVVGWDIAILDHGPVLIEGNSSPDLDIVQRTHRRPVGGGDRLGALLAAELTRGALASAPGR